MNPILRGPLDDILDELKPEYIIGIDEVGWGAIAGPVLVAVAVFPLSWKNTRIHDSKTYSSDKVRNRAFEIIEQQAAFIGYQEASPEEILANGAGPTLQKLFLELAERAVALYPNSLIVVDGSLPIAGLDHPQIAIPKADKLIPAVSAASVVAKVTRDKEMIALGKDFPEYDWATNKGYGTVKHLEAMERVGVCDHHRLNIQLVLDYKTKYGTYEKGLVT